MEQKEHTVNQITIPKTTKTVFVFPSYISNGHWAVKKSKVKNADLFSSESVARLYLKKGADFRINDSDNVTATINANIIDPVQYSATPYFTEIENKLCRFFVNATTGELTLFNCEYLTLLGLNHANAVLWGSHPHTCFRDTQKAKDMHCLLMPVRFEAQKLTVFQATLRALSEETAQTVA